MVDLSKKLKSLRKAQGLTQAQVADRIGVTKALISAYESGSRQPGYENLIKLAGLFKVTTDWLLGMEKSDAFHFNGLSESQAEAVMRIIKEFENANFPG